MKSTRRLQARITKIVALASLLAILSVQNVKADINYDLLYNWSYQPANVQNNLVRQNTNIQVVDQLPWVSPDLYETYAYTTMNVVPGTRTVSSVDIVIKKGCESSLTHEVGHAISNYNRSVYWWCEQPIFEQIWLAERYNSIITAQGWYDKREYFACAYDCYIRYPQFLKNSQPMTYNYIQVVLNYTY